MKILIAVDGSEPSEAALRKVREMVWPPGSTVRVLSAAFDPVVVPEVGAVDYARAKEALHHEAEQVVSRAAKSLGGSSAAVEPVVRSGDPRLAILDEAAAWEADLIVVGSHGRTGLKRMLMGSVAEYIVRHAPCSVEVARERKRASQTPHS